MAPGMFADVEKMVRKSLLKQKMKYPDKPYAYQREVEDLQILKNLGGKFPSNSGQIAKLDTATKAKLLKKELKKTFPTGIFSVKTSRYSMGSAIDVAYADGVSPKKVEPIVNKYSHDYGSDSQTDYFNVSNYAHVQRKLTAKGKAKKEALKMKLQKMYSGSQNVDEYWIDRKVRDEFNEMNLPFGNPKDAVY